MPAQKPRRFEFREGASDKFWEVSTAGKEMTTRWGRAGTGGRSKTKAFATPAEARAAAAKLVDEKLGEGYAEAGGSGPRPGPRRPVDPKAAASVEAAWGRIDAWLARHAPEVLAKMGKPATAAALAEAEAALGLELPGDVRASYLVHDGCTDIGLFPSGEYASLARMVRDHGSWREVFAEGPFDGEEDRPEGPIRRVHRHPRWVSLLFNDADGTLIDLAPAEGGKVGQLIDFSHETGPERVAAPSLAVYLGRLADALESGAGAYNPEGYFEWPSETQLPRSAFPPAPKKSTPTKKEAGVPARRYFEFTGGTSNKFWEVFHEGAELTTRYGRVGTAGRSTTKSYAVPEKAASAAARIIAEKVEEGYVEKP